MVIDREDLWIDRWMKLLKAAGGNGRVLEIGCANGRDTAWLEAQGFRVVATDVSMDALRVCASAAPGVGLIRHDLRHPLPFADGTFGAVIASLSLHYFPWAETMAAMQEIRRVLRPPWGVMLCRLNSTRDVLHGADSGGRAIERHFYEVHDTYSSRKRFFDKDEVLEMFEGWKVLSCVERTIFRYEKPKVVWEVVAR
ncbi:class I SAM-dependent methyltransferase [Ramlibacter sp.]|uniref:class I SAM-dependent methyltransferase n=1 Tax=Ramlibacter sp. TaxID=1917967 RepID=UPI003D128593